MGKLKNEALGKDGVLYNALADTSSRLITSAVMTCIMLLVATGLSFFLPTALVLLVLFAPGVLTFALGGTLPKMHYAYNLTQNQRLAIEAYMESDETSRRDFPAGFIETVRKAKNDKDQRQLCIAAQSIVKLQRERLDSMDIRDDKVSVALKVMGEKVQELENDIQSRKEVFGSSPKALGRKQDR